MIESLTHISVSLFVLYFGIFTAICIIIGKLWINADGSNQFPTPDSTRFDPITIAALRGGWKSVVQTAIFSLWDRDLIKIGMDAVRTQGQYVAQGVPEHNEDLIGIERDIFQFCKQRRIIKYIFWSAKLKARIKQDLEPVYKELEQLHLVRTASDRYRVWGITSLMSFLVAVAGTAKIYILITIAGTGKFYLETSRGSSVIFLIFLLIGMQIVLLLSLKPWKPMTRLGYLFSASEKFIVRPSKMQAFASSI